MEASAHFTIHLSEDVVYGNMWIFKNCSPGEKLLMDRETGALQTDDRRMQWVQRAVFGAFGSDVVEKTLSRSVEIIKSAAIDGERTRKSSHAYKIYCVYLEAIQGIRKLAETYRGEGKGMAEKLDSIATNYFKLFTTLPDLQKQSAPKKKMAARISFRTYAGSPRGISGNAVEMKTFGAPMTTTEAPSPIPGGFSEPRDPNEIAIDSPEEMPAGDAGKEPLILETDWMHHTNETDDGSEDKVNKRKKGFFQTLFSCCC